LSNSAKLQNTQKNYYFVRYLLFFLTLSHFISLNFLYAEEYWPDDKWRTATPESQGISSDTLSDMIDYLWQNDYDINSILVIRNGYIVLDTYNFPARSIYSHQVFSVTKSISSTLIGIAIDKG